MKNRIELNTDYHKYKQGHSKAFDEIKTYDKYRLILENIILKYEYVKVLANRNWLPIFEEEMEDVRKSADDNFPLIEMEKIELIFATLF